jgi:hypothetical protein
MGRQASTAALRLARRWAVERIETVGYERCVLWGAGAKGLGSLNSVDPIVEWLPYQTSIRPSPVTISPSQDTKSSARADFPSMDINTGSSRILPNAMGRKLPSPSSAFVRNVISGH